MQGNGRELIGLASMEELNELINIHRYYEIINDIMHNDEKLAASCKGTD